MTTEVFLQKVAVEELSWDIKSNQGWGFGEGNLFTSNQLSSHRIPRLSLVSMILTDIAKFDLPNGCSVPDFGMTPGNCVVKTLKMTV